jgi:AcrR family transcriptional regulator
MTFDQRNIYWWRPLEGEESPDTRTKILFAAYQEIHVNGFQAASLNNILARTGVTKGALYHHFPNKTALGYAVIEEVIAKRIHLSFVRPMGQAQNPIQALIQLIQDSGFGFSLEDIQLGCPLGNLAQEMAPIDEGFRLRLEAIYRQWYDAIIDAIQRAQQQGQIVADVDPEQTAIMVVATLEGCLNVGMISRNKDKLLCCGGGLIHYLNMIQTSEET